MSEHINFEMIMNHLSDKFYKLLKVDWTTSNEFLFKYTEMEIFSIIYSLEEHNTK